MPEKKRTPPQQQEMGNVSQFKGHLHDQSADELLIEMEIRLDTMTDQSYEGDMVDAYLAALEKKAPIEQKFDAEIGWDIFRSQHAILFEEEDSSEFEARPHRSHFRRLVPRVAVAAAVAVILGMFCAQAAGFDVFGAIGQWTEETFRFVPSYATPSSENRDEEVFSDMEQYATLQEAFKAYSISEPLAPTWIPEGYTLDYVEVSPFTDQIMVSASYSKGQDSISLVYAYQMGSTFYSSTFEKDGTSVISYTKGGIVHYIMSNETVLTAAWINGTCECSISGELEVEEMKAIIDSIYLSF